MERSIRIGKDFNVRWSINKVVDGERQPYELAGKELVLQYRTPYGLKEATEWKTEGNTIVWTFRGKEQKALGSYELILTENGGKDGMVTVDTCRAFKLVAHSCEETEGSGSDIVIEDVVLESEVAFAALRGPQGERGPEGPQGPQGEQGPQGPKGEDGYDDTEIKAKLTELSEEIGEVAEKIDNINPAPMLSVTYAELVALRDNGELVAGMQYRITDYITTTAQENTQSAGHQFDVIVTADNENTLNEVARACLHEGDTYFSEAGANLAAWQLWYSLDNNAERFAWADAENGKGVIYRMIDEWNNDCPYDFKNIQFKRDIYADGMGIEKEEGDGDFQVYCYTFSWEDTERIIMDASIVGNNGYLLNDEAQISGVYGNTIKPYISYTGEIESPRTTRQFLNNIVFLSTFNFEGSVFYGCYSNSFGYNCNSNSFGNYCYYNSFGNDCNSNSLGNGCNSNSFGNNCNSNSLGNDCNSNSFGNDCNSNSLGNGCNSNSFGNNCNSNSFGNDCYYNSFGNDCNSNSFGYNCNSNSFGYNCNSNSFGNYCYYNSFGNGCYYNRFKDTDGIADNASYNRADDGVHDVELYYDDNNGNYSELRNHHICRGVNSRRVEIYSGRDFETTYTMTSDGELREFVLGDVV